MMLSYSTLLIVLLIQVCRVAGHGRLMNPPSRNSMWRFGFYNPVDVYDNELWCGGLKVQWELNDGKCGVCGDPWNEPKPRSHEIGGIFANGKLVRQYTTGQVIDIEIELTSNHKGYFEMRLCPLIGNVVNAETEECFNNYPLYLEGQSTYRYTIPEKSKKHEIIKYRVQLPEGVACTHCVIQWMYYAAHLNGTCEDGTVALGCGKQETYRNCADVTIIANKGIVQYMIPSIPISQNLNPYAIKLVNQIYEGSNEQTLVVRFQFCMAIGKFQGIDYYNAWCMSSCLSYPPVCPQDACHCIISCSPKEELPQHVQVEEELFCEHDCFRNPLSERCSKYCHCI